MHQQIGNVLRIRVHEYPPRTLGDAQALVDEQLEVTSHSNCSNVSLATGYSPGALAFHRDMFLDVPYVADLLAVRDRRQLRVDKDRRRANSKRISHDYKVGDQALKKRHEWSKLGEKWDGPYVVTRAHVNGNVTVQLCAGVTERLNIRRVKPYKNPTVSGPENPVVPVQPIGHRTRGRS